MMGKAICFHKTDPKNNAKKSRPQDFYEIFQCACVKDKLTKTGTADLITGILKSIFRTGRVHYM